MNHNIENSKNTLTRLLERVRDDAARKADYIAPTHELQKTTADDGTPVVVIEQSRGVPTKQLAANPVAFGQLALTALYRNRLPDYLIMFFVILGISVPSFVVAAVSQLGLVGVNSVLGITLLPVAGWGTLSHMLLPALVLGLGTMAYLTRLMRSSMLEVIGSDYVRTAKAKGLPAARIFSRHQLRNAILPVITVLGPSIAAITTGGFVVELVFAIPGLGRYFVQAVQQLDYTVIMGTTVFYGAFLVFMVIVVDVLYGFIDPRVRMK